MSNLDNDLERQLSELLTDGDMQGELPEQEAPHKLSPRYEIRVRAKHDPIAEETRKIRQIADEIDDRYDQY